MKKSYILTLSVFIFGLILISVIKNKTRKMQAEINDLKASILELKITLHESILEHHVLTSPEYISILAKEYLDPEFTYYTKEQIQNISEINNAKIKNMKIKAKKEFARTKPLIPNASAMNIVNVDLEKKIFENLMKSKSPTSRVTKWTGMQILKLILGIPPVPGK